MSIPLGDVQRGQQVNFCTFVLFTSLPTNNGFYVYSASKESVNLQSL